MSKPGPGAAMPPVRFRQAEPLPKIPGDYRAVSHALPTGCTFPDGEPITAYRVYRALAFQTGNPSEDRRVYGLRLGNELFIFALVGEEATANATATVALIDRGEPIGSNLTAYTGVFGF